MSIQFFFSLTVLHTFSTVKQAIIKHYPLLADINATASGSNLESRLKALVNQAPLMLMIKVGNLEIATHE